MKKYREIERKHIAEVIDATFCDFCGNKIKAENYSKDETFILHRSGYCYPDGGTWEDHRVDICTDCYEREVLPWLESRCIEPQVRETDI